MFVYLDNTLRNKIDTYIIMKQLTLISLASVACIFYFAVGPVRAAKKHQFPVVIDWIKRSLHNTGCVDPTEPFQCPGSNICISLQFLCDGHPGDCPNNYDENKGLCVAGIHKFLISFNNIITFFLANLC